MTSEEVLASLPPEEEDECERAGEDLFKMVNRYYFCGHIMKISRDENASLGSHVWQAGVGLCHYFEREEISFAGKKVIELGSGTGIVGILAVLLGGNVTFTDQTFVLKQIKYNISVNIPASCKDRTKVCSLHWGEDQNNFPSDYDIILGSDIVYSRSSYPLLLQTLKHLSNQGTTIYISSQIRPLNKSEIYHEEVLTQHFNSQLVHQNKQNNVNI
uniref:Protein-lysine methyltransferase METTL21B-like n=2 Tax=Callorhinchus milii TaxID=7868 RepID=A0A4W3JIE9_CALMI